MIKKQIKLTYDVSSVVASVWKVEVGGDWKGYEEGDFRGLFLDLFVF